MQLTGFFVFYYILIYKISSKKYKIFGCSECKDRESKRDKDRWLQQRIWKE